MGKQPKTSNQRKDQKTAKIVSYEEAKRRSVKADGAAAASLSLKPRRAKLSSRKEFKIERGQLREGALYDPSEELSPEGKVQLQPQSRFAQMAEAKRQARAERKRMRTKREADKKFDKAYGAQDTRPSAKKGNGSAVPANDGSPRPALYKTKMGAKQKKSSKLQAKGKVGKVADSITVPAAHLPRLPRKLGVVLTALCVTVICVIALYGPAQQYYTQMRETDRLQAEYAAVAARSDSLQSSIDSLQTDAGIEDKAHADLGYVKANEQTATVKGVTFDDTKEFTTNVVPGSIPAPDTWYSPFLDVLFGYGN